MLPRVLAAVDDAGLPAQRYVGEIDSIKSAITHGSLSARKLRNYAGLQGVLAFVLENRLDRSDLTFPTPRNIAVRTRKQYESVVAFLETCAAQGTQIVAAAEAAQRTLTSPPEGYRLPARLLILLGLQLRQQAGAGSIEEILGFRTAADFERLAEEARGLGVVLLVE